MAQALLCPPAQPTFDPIPIATFHQLSLKVSFSVIGQLTQFNSNKWFDLLWQSIVVNMVIFSI